MIFFFFFFGSQIPYVVIAEQAKTLYSKTLEAWAGDNRIISVDEKKTLDNMAAFLSMDSSAVDEIHSDVRAVVGTAPLPYRTAAVF